MEKGQGSDSDHTLNRASRFGMSPGGVLWLPLSFSTVIYYDWQYD
jgi:hypothetical protein